MLHQTSTILEVPMPVRGLVEIARQAREWGVSAKLIVRKNADLDVQGEAAFSVGRPLRG
jgi:hypothetical protein